jgi:hypothetical protein
MPHTAVAWKPLNGTLVMQNKGDVNVQPLLQATEGVVI